MKHEMWNETEKSKTMHSKQRCQALNTNQQQQQFGGVSQMALAASANGLQQVNGQVWGPQVH